MNANDQLSPQAQEALRTADALVARDRALLTLLSLSGDASLWCLSGELSARLRRFEAGAYPRIRAGFRKPRDAMEAGGAGGDSAGWRTCVP